MDQGPPAGPEDAIGRAQPRGRAGARGSRRGSSRGRGVARSRPGDQPARPRLVGLDHRRPRRPTPAGAAAPGDLLAGVSAHRRRVADGITAEEYRATVAVLHRMAANLGWVDPGDSPGR